MKPLASTFYLSIILCLFFFGCEENKPSHDQIPPELYLSGFDGIVQDSITITAEAYDTGGISKVEFYINDSLMFNDTSDPYVYEWGTAEGSNCDFSRIKVVAYDNQLNLKAIEAIVFINNSVDSSDSGINASIWYTSGEVDGPRHERKSDKYFGTPCSPPTALNVNISTNEIYQEIDGFGAALTNSSAWLIDNSTKREEIIDKLFSPDSGIGISYIRLAMGSSDFVHGEHYSYAETPNDTTLSDFSIDRDREHIIPVLQDILAINPVIKIMGSPWSPPGWMKEEWTHLNDTTMWVPGGQFICANKWYDSRLQSSMYSVYGDYFVKFLESYADEGIIIDAVTIQNEPLYCPVNYPGMLMSGDEQRDFVKYHLGPKFEENGINTKIIIFDHNWDGTDQTGAFDFIQTVYSDQDAVSYIDGTAFHGYGNGDAFFQNEIHNMNPNKSIYFTERTNIQDWKQWKDVLSHIAKYYFFDVIRNWSKNVLLWNLALDTENSPYNGGCDVCTGVVTVEEDDFEKEIDYYIIGHFSKFVQQGANRIYSNTFEGELETVAFRNPDGSLVVVTLNPQEFFPEEPNKNTVFYKINWNGVYFNHSLSAQSMATFVWEP